MVDLVIFLFPCGSLGVPEIAVRSISGRLQSGSRLFSYVSCNFKYSTTTSTESARIKMVRLARFELALFDVRSVIDYPVADRRIKWSER